MATTIVGIYNERKLDSRDREVQDKINIFFNSNVPALSDGLINVTPVISADKRANIEKSYNITAANWNTITKLSEFRLMKQLATPLKLGLLISYCQTKNVIYINFLMILIYSSLLVKYFKQGYDKNVMKYTIDNADGRMDFKKYGGSLIMVINKKVETFDAKFSREIGPNPSDKLLRELLQSITSRINDTVKIIAKEYYMHFNDPDVKIMMNYVKTDDGKNVLSPLSVLETIRERSVNNLAFPSDKALNLIGLTSGNSRKIQYRIALTGVIPEVFMYTSAATSSLMDEWMQRNKHRLSLQTFRSNFMKSMSVARNMTSVNNNYDKIVDITLNKYSNMKLSRVDLRKYVQLYLLANIYISSLSILNK